MWMPRKLPPHVERNSVKGHTYLSFRIGKGPRLRLPSDPTSQAFRNAYAAALASYEIVPTVKRDTADSFGALIESYLRSGAFTGLADMSKPGYMSRLTTMREEHGHRSVAGLTRERIEKGFLAPLADRPAAQLDTLKKLRILIRHAIDKRQLSNDPSLGIKRPKTKEVRAWTDAEMSAFERRWPIGTKQRTAYALMLNAGTARVDVHRITWAQIDHESVDYTRHKSKVAVQIGIAAALRAALDSAPREHVTVINTEFGKPFTIDGFSGFMRDAMRAAGLPLDCKPHGLRKTLGRLLADAGASAHDIMAALGHTTLAQAEKYTREADRRRGGRRAVAQLDDHMRNRSCPNRTGSLGKIAKKEG
jgi:enterobacteria phage integrase